MDSTQVLDESDDEYEKQKVGFLKLSDGTEFPIFEGVNTIGRDDIADITIPKQSLSKKHAVIDVNGRDAVLIDIGSRNKTRKNKTVLKPFARNSLNDKDEFTLANIKCQFFLQRNEEDDTGSMTTSETDSESMLPIDDEEQGKENNDTLSNKCEIDKIDEGESGEKFKDFGNSPQLADEDSDESDSILPPTQNITSVNDSFEDDLKYMNGPEGSGDGKTLVEDSDTESEDEKELNTPTKNPISIVEQTPGLSLTEKKNQAASNIESSHSFSLKKPLKVKEDNVLQKPGEKGIDFPKINDTDDYDSVDHHLVETLIHEDSPSLGASAGVEPSLALSSCKSSIKSLEEQPPSPKEDEDNYEEVCGTFQFDLDDCNVSYEAESENEDEDLKAKNQKADSIITDGIDDGKDSGINELPNKQIEKLKEKEDEGSSSQEIPYTSVQKFITSTQLAEGFKSFGTPTSDLTKSPRSSISSVEKEVAMKVVEDSEEDETQPYAIVSPKKSDFKKPADIDNSSKSSLPGGANLITKYYDAIDRSTHMSSGDENCPKNFENNSNKVLDEESVDNAETQPYTAIKEKNAVSQADIDNHSGADENFDDMATQAYHVDVNSSSNVDMEEATQAYTDPYDPDAATQRYTDDIANMETQVYSKDLDIDNCATQAYVEVTEPEEIRQKEENKLDGKLSPDQANEEAAKLQCKNEDNVKVNDSDEESATQPYIGDIQEKVSEMNPEVSKSNRTSRTVKKDAIIAESNETNNQDNHLKVDSDEELATQPYVGEAEENDQIDNQDIIPENVKVDMISSDGKRTPEKQDDLVIKKVENLKRLSPKKVRFSVEESSDDDKSTTKKKNDGRYGKLLQKLKRKTTKAMSARLKKLNSEIDEPSDTDADKKLEVATSVENLETGTSSTLKNSRTSNDVKITSVIALDNLENEQEAVIPPALNKTKNRRSKRVRNERYSRTKASANELETQSSDNEKEVVVENIETSKHNDDKSNHEANILLHTNTNNDRERLVLPEILDKCEKNDDSSKSKLVETTTRKRSTRNMTSVKKNMRKSSRKETNTLVNKTQKKEKTEAVPDIVVALDGKELEKTVSHEVFYNSKQIANETSEDIEKDKKKTTEDKTFKKNIATHGKRQPKQKKSSHVNQTRSIKHMDSDDDSLSEESINENNSNNITCKKSKLSSQEDFSGPLKKKLNTSNKQKIGATCSKKKSASAFSVEDDNEQSNRYEPKVRKRDSTILKPKVVFTGISDKNMEKMIKDYGGEISPNIRNASHLFTDKVRRTVKFLCAISLGIPILASDTLKSSNLSTVFASWKSYTLKDETSERKYKFQLKKSIEKASTSPLLQNYEIHVTKNVKPDPNSMKEIIECAGGKFLGKPPRKPNENTLIISCGEDVKQYEKFQTQGYTVCSNELLLTGILRQQLDTQLFSIDNLEENSGDSTLNETVNPNQVELKRKTNEKNETSSKRRKRR